MKEYKVSLTWVLVIAVGTIVGASFLSAVTPLGEQINVLAVTIAGDVVCSQCVGTNGDGTNDIKDGSVTNSKIASLAVTKSKLASNSVDGGKISDGTISAADLGPDSVGASEIKGVSKLIFAQCILTNDEATTNLQPLEATDINCTISGVDLDDSAIATFNNPNLCFHVANAEPETNNVQFIIENECSTAQHPGSGSSIAVMVFDK